MQELFSIAVLLTALLSSVAGQQQKDDLSVATLGNALYCLQSKVSAIGYPPPRFSEHAFKLRYLLGAQEPGDQENELQLVVYGPSERKAVLYQVYFEEYDHRPTIYIGEIGTLIKKENVIVPDEIWGGVGTYEQIKRLLRKLSSRPEVTVMDNQVKQGPRGCVFQR